MTCLVCPCRREDPIPFSTDQTPTQQSAEAVAKSVSPDHARSTTVSVAQLISYNEYQMRASNDTYYSNDISNETINDYDPFTWVDESHEIAKNYVYSEYLDLLCKEIEIINPKTIITLGNQVSSIVLNKNISVSQCRKQNFIKNIAGREYRVYPVYYPIGNGMMNIDKAVEDLIFIIKTNM